MVEKKGNPSKIWMIWGYHHFRKPLHLRVGILIVFSDFLYCVNLGLVFLFLDSWRTYKLVVLDIDYYGYFWDITIMDNDDNYSNNKH